MPPPPPPPLKSALKTSTDRDPRRFHQQQRRDESPRQDQDDYHSDSEPPTTLEIAEDDHSGPTSPDVAMAKRIAASPRPNASTKSLTKVLDGGLAPFKRKIQSEAVPLKVAPLKSALKLHKPTVLNETLKPPPTQSPSLIPPTQSPPLAKRRKALAKEDDGEAEYVPLVLIKQPQPPPPKPPSQPAKTRAAPQAQAQVPKRSPQTRRNTKHLLAASVPLSAPSIRPPLQNASMGHQALPVATALPDNLDSILTSVVQKNVAAQSEWSKLSGIAMAVTVASSANASKAPATAGQLPRLNTANSDQSNSLLSSSSEHITAEVPSTLPLLSDDFAMYHNFGMADLPMPPTEPLSRSWDASDAPDLPAPSDGPDSWVDSVFEQHVQESTDVDLPQESMLTIIEDGEIQEGMDEPQQNTLTIVEDGEEDDTNAPAPAPSPIPALPPSSVSSLSPSAPFLPSEVENGHMKLVRPRPHTENVLADSVGVTSHATANLSLFEPEHTQVVGALMLSSVLYTKPLLSSAGVTSSAPLAGSSLSPPQQKQTSFSQVLSGGDDGGTQSTSHLNLDTSKEEDTTSLTSAPQSTAEASYSDRFDSRGAESPGSGWGVHTKGWQAHRQPKRHRQPTRQLPAIVLQTLLEQQATPNDSALSRPWWPLAGTGSLFAGWVVIDQFNKEPDRPLVMEQSSTKKPRRRTIDPALADLQRMQAKAGVKHQVAYAQDVQALLYNARNLSRDDNSEFQEDNGAGAIPPGWNYAQYQ